MTSSSGIENCPLQLRCNMKWQDLPESIAGEKVRLCTQCKEPVYLIDVAEAAEHAALGHCVAIADPESPRKEVAYRGRMGVFMDPTSIDGSRRLRQPNSLAKTQSNGVEVHVPDNNELGTRDKTISGRDEHIDEIDALGNSIVSALIQAGFVKKSDEFDVLLLVFEAIEAQKAAGKI